MYYVWAGLRYISIKFSENSDVLVAVQQRVLFLTLDTHVTSTGVGRLVCLEAGVGEYDDQALGVLVGRRDGDMLLCDELRKLRRWQRLSACHGQCVRLRTR